RPQPRSSLFPYTTLFRSETDEYIFYDCSPESPKGRRSLCYDQDALASRKEHKPKNSTMGMASEMGIELLTEEQYRELQKLGAFRSEEHTSELQSRENLVC